MAYPGATQIDWRVSVDAVDAVEVQVHRGRIRTDRILVVACLLVSSYQVSRNISERRPDFWFVSEVIETHAFNNQRSDMDTAV